jgi:hypothetical protein
LAAYGKGNSFIGNLAKNLVIGKNGAVNPHSVDALKKLGLWHAFDITQAITSASGINVRESSRPVQLMLNAMSKADRASQKMVTPFRKMTLSDRLELAWKTDAFDRWSDVISEHTNMTLAQIKDESPVFHQDLLDAGISNPDVWERMRTGVKMFDGYNTVDLDAIKDDTLRKQWSYLLYRKTSVMVNNPTLLSRHAAQFAYGAAEGTKAAFMYRTTMQVFSWMHHTRMNALAEIKRVQGSKGLIKLAASQFTMALLIENIRALISGQPMYEMTPEAQGRLMVRSGVMALGGVFIGALPAYIITNTADRVVQGKRLPTMGEMMDVFPSVTMDALKGARNRADNVFEWYREGELSDRATARLTRDTIRALPFNNAIMWNGFMRAFEEELITQIDPAYYNTRDESRSTTGQTVENPIAPVYNVGTSAADALMEVVE